MPRKEQTPKKKTPKKKTKEKSTKKSEAPKMDEDEINRLMQNALDQANARAEQKFEERLTALREEFNQKHQEEMTELQEQLAQSRGGFTTQEKYAVKELMVDAVTAAHKRTQQKCLRTFISRRNLLLTKPITYHMDFITELHPLVEGHLMDARVQGE